MKIFLNTQDIINVILWRYMNGKILLVEDDILISMVEAQTIKKYGYEVLTASTGEEAVELVDTHPDISLVLMDIDLGSGIDGTQAAQEILKDHELPIIFLTAHTEKDFVDRVKKISSYGYVIKDSGEFVLMESINMACQLFEAHQETKRHEGKYRLITENSGDLVLTIDDQFRVTYVSPSVESLLGYSQEEFAELDVAEVLSKESLERKRTLFRERSPEDHSMKEIMLEYHRKDGTIFWGATRIKPMFDEPGHRVGSIVSTRDATAQQLAEDRLFAERTRLQRILEASNEGTWEWNVQSGEVRFNERWAQIIGYSLDELAPLSIETWRRCCFAEDLERSNRLLEKHFKGETDFYETELRMRHKDGGVIFVRDTGKVVEWDEQGRPLRMYGTHQDITWQKRTEEKFISFPVSDGFHTYKVVAEAMRDESGKVIGVTTGSVDVTEESG